ncbi:MAG: HlyC/CorC family transporter [bacterium]|nr:HlyC/CorC family transporter [bacterium]
MASDNPDEYSSSGLKKIFSWPFKKKGNNKYNSRAYDNLDTPRQDMIKGVFELSAKNARDIMIPRVDIIAVDSNIDLKSLVKIVTDAGHSRLPVYEEIIDNIIGILYAKDLLNLLIEKSSKKFQLKKILHDPYFVPETMPLDELLLEFKHRRLHIAVVMDEYGGVDGVITLEDILEEIVGEITDEFDDEKLPEIQQISGNTYEVDSRLTISDFNNKTNLNLPLEDFDTIGGFVFDLFGKIPKKNEEITHKNIIFKIKDIKGTKINRILVSISE